MYIGTICIRVLLSSCQVGAHGYTTFRGVSYTGRCKNLPHPPSKVVSNRKAMTTEQRFLEWYDQYADKLFRYCLYRLFDRDRAKDMTQQIFLKTWEYLTKENTIDSPQAFLYRTATNLIIDEKEKKQPVSLDELLTDGFEPSYSEEESWITNMEVKKVIDTIAKLDPIYKDVLLMRYVDGLKPKEIAEVLGETQNVISVRIHRGKNELKTLIKQHIPKEASTPLI